VAKQRVPCVGGRTEKCIEDSCSRRRLYMVYAKNNDNFVKLYTAPKRDIKCFGSKKHNNNNSLTHQNEHKPTHKRKLRYRMQIYAKICQAFEIKEREQLYRVAPKIGIFLCAL